MLAFDGGAFMAGASIVVIGLGLLFFGAFAGRGK